MKDEEVTDLSIQAFVDNELDPAESSRVREFIESSIDAKRRYKELCRQKKMLVLWWNQQKTH